MRLEFAASGDESKHLERDVRIFLERDGSTRVPDAATEKSAERQVGAFYELPAGRYSLGVISPAWRIDPTTVDVRSGETLIQDRTRLVPKPSLQVAVIDRSARTRRPDVSLLACDDLGPGKGLWPDLHACTLTRSSKGTNEPRFAFLDARRYFALAELEGRRAGAQVDLRDGRDARIEIELRSTHVHGFVTRGGTGINADLAFRNTVDTSATTVSSSDDGSYAVDLLSAGLYEVAVTPVGTEPNRAARTVLDLVTMPDDLEKDFSVPRADVELTLRDAKTREPLDGATVSYTLGGVGRTSASDATGRVSLPLLYPGMFRCRAEAARYRSDWATFAIADSDGLQSFELLLQPLRDELSFRVTSPSGEPVPSPFLFGRYDGVTRFALMQKCDADGTCRFADRPPDAETFFVFHPNGALTPFTAGAALADRSVVLRTSGGPLIVRVRRGPSTTAILKLEASIDGVFVPLQAFVIAATLSGATNAEVMLHKGGNDVFVIPGLPAGVITCFIRDIAIVPGSPIVEPFMVALPQSEPATVSVP